ncbi:hypothetical protein HDU84_004975 [Entophlyctis sp. JEL0112]|nr:hypothetical protein HDU84_004975 [Entophlyctis sp. JEL0112]
MSAQHPPAAGWCVGENSVSAHENRCPTHDSDALDRPDTPATLHPPRSESEYAMLPPCSAFLGEQIFRSAGTFDCLLDVLRDSDVPAIRSVDNRKPLSHAKLRRFIADCQLPVSGLSQVSRVGVLLEEGPELAVCLVTVMSSCCVVPINYHLTHNEVLAELQSLRVCVVIVDHRRKKVNRGFNLACLLLRNAQEHLTQLLTAVGVTVVLLKADSAYAGLFTLSSYQPQVLANSSDSIHSQATVPPILKNDIVMILRTSGTSGKKKTVPYTLKTLIVGAKCVAHTWELKAGKDINLNMMPLFHVGGIVRNLLAPLVSNTTVIVTPGFDPQAFWEILQNQSPTWFYAVPTMHMAILERGCALLDESRRAAGTTVSAYGSNAGLHTSIRMIANAGGGLPHTLAMRLRQMFSGCVVLPSYGMTECMPIASPPPTYALQKPGCSGVSVGPEIAIMRPAATADFETRRMPAGEIGRIMVRGPPLFAGYEDDDAANREAFTCDGFFDTGDMGFLDADGYLYITGRSKEIINRGGETISPVEIEDAVLQHPKVSNALAFSAPHSALQETTGIVIVSKDDNCRVGLSELQKFLSSSLHASKWPQLIVFMNDIPKNHSGKPLRIGLADRLGLPEISETTHPLQRTFDAVCPVKGTASSVPISCKYVACANVDNLQKILSQMPYKHDVFVFSESPENVVVLISGTSMISSTLVLKYLSDKVHDYHLPQSITVVPEIPKTPNGLVDREACLALYEEITREDLTVLERRLVELYKEVLALAKLPKKNDDFFELGGSSLSVGKLVGILRTRHGIKVKPIDVMECRTAAALAKLISQSPDSFKLGSADTILTVVNPHTKEDEEEVNSKSQTSFLALCVQLLPLFLLRPLRTSCFYLIFTHAICFLKDTVFYFSDAPRGSLKGSAVIILNILMSFAFTTLIMSIIDPMTVIISKWLIIGRYRPGRVLPSGIFSICEFTKLLYFRILGAKIGWNVQIHPDTILREFDLIRIYPDCIVATSALKAFSMEPGLMVLKPVVLGSNCVLNANCSIAAGSSIPANTVLPPLSSSHELHESSEKYKIFASTGARMPRIWDLLLVCVPVITCVKLFASIPWILVMYWLVQFPFFGNQKSVRQAVSSFGQLMIHQKQSFRIGIYLLGAVVNSTVSPWLQVAAVIFVKRNIIGVFEAGQKQDNDRSCWRKWLMDALVDNGEFYGVYDLLGRHYEGVSTLYRLLGAKVGRRVYWPGTPMKLVELDLLRVGDDAVFGSRSSFVFSDAVESRAIDIGPGAMVADRCVVLPGVVIGKNATIGSGSLLRKNGFYPPGSVWVGSRGGDAVLWEKGSAEAECMPSVKPFGRAFYEKQAPYLVFSEAFIVLYNTLLAAVQAVLWAVVPLLGIFAAGTLFEVQSESPAAMAGVLLAQPRISLESLGILVFITGVVASHGTVVCVAYSAVISTKWLLMGKLHSGSFDWDKSSHCQRWQVLISVQRVIDKVHNHLCGTWYLVEYFRALGCDIGAQVCLYPTGGDPMMTEPDLVSIGDHSVIDRASVVGHINSKGYFTLNSLRIGKRCALATDSRLLSGAEMRDGATLLEHTLVIGGEVVGAGTLMQGWPAVEVRLRERDGRVVSVSAASSRDT